MSDMKLAWICYGFTFDKDDGYDLDNPTTIVFKEPEQWKYVKVVPIVYAEIEKDK